MSLLARAASDPLPMAHPTSAAARAGASLTPSPTITTCRDRRLRMAARASTLPAGLRPLWAEAIPSSAATVLHGRLGCRRSGWPRRGPCRPGGPRPAPASGRSGVVTAMAPTTSPSRSTITTVSPRVVALGDRGRSGSGRRSRSSRPTSTRLSVDRPGHARSRVGTARRRPGRPRGRAPAAAAMAVAMGCSLSASTAAASESTTSSSVMPGSGDDRGDLGVPLGEGPGLVEHHPVHLGQPLEDVAAADEDAQGRGPTAAHHHGHRGGQAHGARAGHQEDGQTAQHGLAQIADHQPPDQEGQRRADQHGGDEHAADPVGQPLQRGLVPLGVLHQSLQAGQHRLGGARSPPARRGPRCRSGSHR